VLEGSVRNAGGRVRITTRLVYALSGADLWADRFDGRLEGVFDLQDKVASSVAGIIEPALQAAEIRRAAERSTTDSSAYDLYLRALPHSALYEKDRMTQALDPCRAGHRARSTLRPRSRRGGPMSLPARG
jgi:adenylate cyclase